MLHISILDVVFLCLTLMAVRLLWSISWSILNDKESEKRRLQASEVLKAHKMTRHLYCAGFGMEEGELKSAVTFFSDRGFVVVDEKGQIVGKMAAAQGCASPSRSAKKSDGASVATFRKLAVVNQ
jgi:hypothetical protein